MADMNYSELFDNYLAAMSEGSGYDRGSEAFANMIKQGISAEQQETYMRNAGYTFIKNKNGGYSYIGKPTIDPPASDNAVLTNSNLQKGTSGAGTDGAYYEQAFGTKTTGETPTGKSTVSQSQTKVYKDGAPTTGTKILGVAGKVLSTAMAYNAGLTLGKVIDGALYDADPDFWDERGMSSMDPDTWGEISSEIESPVGRFAFNLLAGVRTEKDTGKRTATMYADADAQAYFAKWLVENGWLNTGGASNVNDFNPAVSEYVIDSNLTSPFKGYPIDNGIYHSKNFFALKIEGGGKIYAYYYNTSFQGVFISDAPFKVYVKTFGDNDSADWKIDGFTTVSHVSANNWHGEFYYADVSTHMHNNDTLKNLVPFLSSYNETHNGNINSIYSAANIFFYNTIKATGGNSPAGVNSQQGATLFNPTGLDSVADYKQALFDQFPWLYDNRLEYDVAQPDGSTKTYTYVPMSVADAFYQNENQPIGDENTLYQGKYDYDGSGMSDTQIATILGWFTQNYPQNQPKNLTDPKDLTDLKTPENPDDIGTGDTPPFIPITGKASSLWAIYNPTIAQLNSLGAWLWSSDFIDQILKLFSDPMQAIIGLHRVYATPATGGEQNIKVGYLDSGVSSLTVTDQYTNVDCGTVKCYEYFGNIFDYAPHTSIKIYLPFVGIVDLNTADVMRSQIHVIYHVDVLSGACLAEVQIVRDSSGGVLYQFAGNAAVTMPISSGSYIGVISNVVGVAARAVAGAAAGGPVGAVVGGVTGALSARGGTEVQHSGGFSGNAGAMGIKKPYLIIERPQTEIAQNFQTLQGYGSNFYTAMSGCKGYTKVKAVHVDAVTSATQEEKEMIESALKSGVIIG